MWCVLILLVGQTGGNWMRLAVQVGCGSVGETGVVIACVPAHQSCPLCASYSDICCYIHQVG